MPAAAKHKWGDPTRTALRTERVCARCGIIKVTRHDAGRGAIPWTEFERDGGRLEGRGTPPCEAVAPEAAT
jgi:hypothetical protein